MRRMNQFADGTLVQVLRQLSYSKIGQQTSKSSSERSLISADEKFQRIPSDARGRQAFLNVIEDFSSSKSHGRGHVEFIKTALKYVKEYGLQKDLDIYKALLNIFPKGPLIPQNIFQRAFLHYPEQQTCCVNLLDQMEWFGVQPDKEVHDIVVNVFGEWNFATKKIKRMLYWMPKLKHTNSFIDRRLVESKNLDHVELSYLALKMICRDPGTQVAFVKVNDSVLGDSEKWLMSAQSSQQMQLLSRIKSDDTLYVDGPNLVYVMDHQVQFVSLFANPNECYYEKFENKEELDEDFENFQSKWECGVRTMTKCSMHEQKNEIILGLAVLGKVCRQSAAAWVNHLQSANPNLQKLRVVLRTKHDESTVITDLSL